MSEESYVFAVRPFCGTRGTAEDSGARDGEDEGAVEGAVAFENGLPAAGVDLGADLAIDPVESSRLFRRLGSPSVRLLSSGHCLCLFCKYRIGGHAANIGQLRVRGLSKCCGQTKFAWTWRGALTAYSLYAGRTYVVLKVDETQIFGRWVRSAFASGGRRSLPKSAEACTLPS